MTPFKSTSVAEVFDAYPAAMRRKLLALRELIFETAADTDGVGALEETLKWGEPAYLTTETKSGSTIRIDWKKSNPTQIALYFNCNTTLVESFRKRFPDELDFEGNRAIVLAESAPIPTEALESCIAAALTYHRRKTSRSRSSRMRM